VANEVNNFFTSIGEVTRQKVQSLANEYGHISSQPFTLIDHPISEQFLFDNISCSDVENIITSLPENKSPGIDKIPTKVIKDSAPVIVPIITNINTSFKTCVFPSDWKFAEIFPILKEGDYEQASNNRPISLLPIMSKVCDKVALNQLTPSLLSSTDAILKGIDQRKVTAVVYLDMSKALFDSVNHDILLNKLKAIGLSPSAVSLFRSYLSHKFQAVRINSTLSDALPVAYGVPQGSVLGALLFNIYVKDLPTVMKSCKSECYVDHSKLLLSFAVSDRETAKDLILSDLERVHNWCFDNVLLLNPDKIKLMVFGSRQMLTKVPGFCLPLLGKELVPCQTIKYLGPKFDPILSFDTHITSNVSYCMSKLGQINRVKHAFNSTLLTTIT
jgi:hypothetical protein